MPLKTQLQKVEKKVKKHFFVLIQKILRDIWSKVFHSKKGQNSNNNNYVSKTPLGIYGKNQLPRPNTVAYSKMRQKINFLQSRSILVKESASSC